MSIRKPLQRYQSGATQAGNDKKVKNRNSSTASNRLNGNLINNSPVAKDLGFNAKTIKLDDLVSGIKRLRNATHKVNNHIEAMEALNSVTAYIMTLDSTDTELRKGGLFITRVKAQMKALQTFLSAVEYN